jgi:putative hydrolase of the HAD superfamily
MTDANDGNRRAVLWDFGGVFVPSPFTHMRSFGPELGLDGDRVLDLVFGPYDEDTDHPWHRLERGEATFADTNEALIVAAAAQGIELDPIALLMRMGEGGRLIRDEVVAVAQRIRATDVRTAIVTNNAAEFRDGWKALIDIDSIAEIVVDSSEVGVRKPNPAIFHLTLDRLGGVAPERAIFLDDAPGNIRAAEALGIHAILVEDDPSPAVAELEAALEA